MNPPPIIDSGQESPLSEQHFAEIRRVMADRAVIDKTCRVAHSSATATLVIGVLAVLTSLISWSAFGLLISLAVTGVGAVEYSAGRRLRRADPKAANVLAINQLVFLGIIILYCIVQMLNKNSLVSAELNDAIAAMPSMQRGVERMLDLLVYIIYGSIIVLSIGFQGGMSLYYFRRGKKIQQVNQGAPAWIRRLLSLIGTQQ